MLGEETIVWGSNGWPTVGKDFVPGTYKITSSSTGLALGVRGAGTANGTPIEEENYASSVYQQWTVAFTYSSGTTADGYYSITSAGSGKAVDLYQSNAANGTLIEQWAPGTGNNQRWFIEETSDGNYRIVSRASSSALSIPTGSQQPNPTVARINGEADAQISFPSQSGWNYSIASSTDLKSWTTLTTLAGTGGAMSYTQSGGGMNSARFWQLDIQQAMDEWTWGDLATQEWVFGSP